MLRAALLWFGLIAAIAVVGARGEPVSEADAFLKSLARANLFSGPVGIATAGSAGLELHKGERSSLSIR